MSYWQATRHPAPCLFFVLPLLIAYEFGVVAVGGPQALAVRNGADAWLRWVLTSAGLGAGIIAPLLVFLVLFVWAYRHRHDPPDDAPGLVVGMALESVGFALAFWALSRSFGPLLDSLGASLAAPGLEASEGSRAGLTRLVTYLGAGIYEEVLFRLVGFCGLAAVLRVAGLPKLPAGLVAAAASALAFAAVHHAGTNGEAVNGYVFGFRTLAGLLFTGVLVLRGFGIAVGAHACYDVLVGIPF